MAKWRKFLWGADVHGNLQHKKSVDQFLRFMADWKPDIKIAGGDIIDMAPLRRKADEHERKQSMREDIEMGKRFLASYRPNYYLRGNHETRLWHLAERSDGVMLDYAQDAIADLEKFTKSLSCKMLPYNRIDGVLKIGNLSFVHGYSQGPNAAKNHALVYGDVVLGHVHSVQQYTVPGFPKPKTGYATGCLCELNMDYAGTQLGSFSHRHAFAYGVINEKLNESRVWIAEEVDGKWLIPSDM